jgi:hypothetical protein
MRNDKVTRVSALRGTRPCTARRPGLVYCLMVSLIEVAEEEVKYIAAYICRCSELCGGAGTNRSASLQQSLLAWLGWQETLWHKKQV